MQVNFNDLLENAGSDFEPIPPGRYDLVVESAEAKTSANGKPMIVATLKVTSGPHTGRKVWNNFVLSLDSPGALGWFFQNMASFGLDRSFFQANPPLEQVAANLTNRTCAADIKQREYQGQMRNEVSKIYPGNNTAPAAPQAAGVPNIPAPAPAPAAPAEVPAPAPTPAAPESTAVTAPPVPF